MGHRNTRLAVLAAAALLAPVLTGCQESTPPTTSASASPSSGSPTSGDPTTAGSSDSGAAAATGPRLSIEPITAHAPAGYRRMDPILSLADAAYDPATNDLVTLTYIPLEPRTKDELVADSRRRGPWVGRPRRLPDVDAAGTSWYHLVGPDRGHAQVHEFGYYRDGNGVRLIFASFNGTIPQETLDSVLASLTWG